MPPPRSSATCSPPNAQFISFGDDGIAFGGRSDSDVYAITATYMVVPDKYEIAVRFQDTDNITDDSEFTIGLNRYISGHDVKWQVNFASADSDDSSKEFDVILVGLNVRV